MTEVIHDAREYLASQGFTTGSRGRFSKEMVQSLKDSGLTFKRPIKDPKERSASNSVPLA